MGAPRQPTQSRVEILSALDDLPPMAPVAIRVMRMVENAETSAADLARVVSRDPGLTAKVLRACNSPYYGLGQRVGGLPQAVVLLGMRSVRNLVLLHSLPVGGSGGGMKNEAERALWTHSVGSALGSRLLAFHCRSVDPETAFLGGLFHDVGRLLLNIARPLAYEALCLQNPAGKPSAQEEREQLGTDHTEVGAGFLERWEMTEDLVEAARTHHETPDLLAPLTLVVRATDEILDLPPLPPGPVPASPPEAGTALARLALEGRVLEDLRERLSLAMEQEAEFFLGAS